MDLFPGTERVNEFCAGFGEMMHGLTPEISCVLSGFQSQNHAHKHYHHSSLAISSFHLRTSYR
jgi:hypothetical protein